MSYNQTPKQPRKRRPGGGKALSPLTTPAKLLKGRKVSAHGKRARRGKHRVHEPHAPREGRRCSICEQPRHDPLDCQDAGELRALMTAPVPEGMDPKRAKRLRQESVTDWRRRREARIYPQ